MSLQHKIRRALMPYPLLTSSALKLWHLMHWQKLRARASRKNIKIRRHYAALDFIRNRDIIRIDTNHSFYAGDILDAFDFYADAVKPVVSSGFNLVDFSTPRYHEVIGYDRHPVLFPSFAEPIVTTQQYLDFANLKKNSVVVDLGAYSGLTSIIFKDIVGAEGRVIAVDADERNMHAIHKNLKLYGNITGNHIETLYGAAWNHNDGLDFSVEGNMGSSATAIVGKRAAVKHVPSFTLNAIAQKFQLTQIDFIKCDIEGAEGVVFEDKAFFEKFKPRIIVEIHKVDGSEALTLEKVMNNLKVHGYTFNKVPQAGVPMPLLECFPPQASQ